MMGIHTCGLCAMLISMVVWLAGCTVLDYRQGSVGGGGIPTTITISPDVSHLNLTFDNTLLPMGTIAAVTVDIPPSSMLTGASLPLTISVWRTVEARNISITLSVMEYASSSNSSNACGLSSIRPVCISLRQVSGPIEVPGTITPMPCPEAPESHRNPAHANASWGTMTESKVNHEISETVTVSRSASPSLPFCDRRVTPRPLLAASNAFVLRNIALCGASAGLVVDVGPPDPWTVELSNVQVGNGATVQISQEASFAVSFSDEEEAVSSNEDEDGLQRRLYVTSFRRWMGNSNLLLVLQMPFSVRGQSSVTIRHARNISILLKERRAPLLRSGKDLSILDGASIAISMCQFDTSRRALAGVGISFNPDTLPLWKIGLVLGMDSTLRIANNSCSGGPSGSCSVSLLFARASFSGTSTRPAQLLVEANTIRAVGLVASNNVLLANPWSGAAIAITGTATNTVMREGSVIRISNNTVVAEGRAVYIGLGSSEGATVMESGSSVIVSNNDVVLYPFTAFNLAQAEVGVYVGLLGSSIVIAGSALGAEISVVHNLLVARGDATSGTNQKQFWKALALLGMPNANQLDIGDSALLNMSSNTLRFCATVGSSTSSCTSNPFRQLTHGSAHDSAALTIQLGKAGSIIAADAIARISSSVISVSHNRILSVPFRALELVMYFRTILLQGALASRIELSFNFVSLASQPSLTSGTSEPTVAHLLLVSTIIVFSAQGSTCDVSGNAFAMDSQPAQSESGNRVFGMLLALELRQPPSPTSGAQLSLFEETSVRVVENNIDLSRPAKLGTTIEIVSLLVISAAAHSVVAMGLKSLVSIMNNLVVTSVSVNATQPSSSVGNAPVYTRGAPVGAYFYAMVPSPSSSGVLTSFVVQHNIVRIGSVSRTAPQQQQQQPSPPCSLLYVVFTGPVVVKGSLTISNNTLATPYVFSVSANGTAKVSSAEAIEAMASLIVGDGRNEIFGLYVEMAGGMRVDASSSSLSVRSNVITMYRSGAASSIGCVIVLGHGSYVTSSTLLIAANRVNVTTVSNNVRHMAGIAVLLKGNPSTTETPTSIVTLSLQASGKLLVEGNVVLLKSLGSGHKLSDVTFAFIAGVYVGAALPTTAASPVPDSPFNVSVHDRSHLGVRNNNVQVEGEDTNAFGVLAWTGLALTASSSSIVDVVGNDLSIYCNRSSSTAAVRDVGCGGIYTTFHTNVFIPTIVSSAPSPTISHSVSNEVLVKVTQNAIVLMIGYRTKKSSPGQARVIYCGVGWNGPITLTGSSWIAFSSNVINVEGVIHRDAAEYLLVGGASVYIELATKRVNAAGLWLNSASRLDVSYNRVTLRGAVGNTVNGTLCVLRVSAMSTVSPLASAAPAAWTISGSSVVSIALNRFSYSPPAADDVVRSLANGIVLAVENAHGIGLALWQASVLALEDNSFFSATDSKSGFYKDIISFTVKASFPTAVPAILVNASLHELAALYMTESSVVLAQKSVIGVRRNSAASSSGGAFITLHIVTAFMGHLKGTALLLLSEGRLDVEANTGEACCAGGFQYASLLTWPSGLHSSIKGYSIRALDASSVRISSNIWAGCLNAASIQLDGSGTTEEVEIPPPPPPPTPPPGSTPTPAPPNHNQPPPGPRYATYTVTNVAFFGEQSQMVIQDNYLLATEIEDNHFETPSDLPPMINLPFSSSSDSSILTLSSTRTALIISGNTLSVDKGDSMHLSAMLQLSFSSATLALGTYITLEYNTFFLSDSSNTDKACIAFSTNVQRDLPTSRIVIGFNKCNGPEHLASFRGASLSGSSTQRWVALTCDVFNRQQLVSRDLYQSAIDQWNAGTMSVVACTNFSFTRSNVATGSFEATATPNMSMTVTMLDSRFTTSQTIVPRTPTPAATPTHKVTPAESISSSTTASGAPLVSPSLSLSRTDASASLSSLTQTWPTKEQSLPTWSISTQSSSKQTNSLSRSRTNALFSETHSSSCRPHGGLSAVSPLLPLFSTVGVATRSGTATTLPPQGILPGVWDTPVDAEVFMRLLLFSRVASQRAPRPETNISVRGTFPVVPVLLCWKVSATEVPIDELYKANVVIGNGTLSVVNATSVFVSVREWSPSIPYSTDDVLQVRFSVGDFYSALEFPQVACAPSMTLPLKEIRLSGLLSSTQEAVRDAVSTVSTVMLVFQLLSGDGGGDLQTMALVSMMACTPSGGAIQNSLGNLRTLSPLLLQDNFEGVIWGNLLLVAVILGAQCIAMMLLALSSRLRKGQKEQQEDAATAIVISGEEVDAHPEQKKENVNSGRQELHSEKTICETVAFPGMLISAGAYAYQGTLFAAVRLIQLYLPSNDSPPPLLESTAASEEDAQAASFISTDGNMYRFMLGVVSAIILFPLPFLIWKFAHPRMHRSFHRFLVPLGQSQDKLNPRYRLYSCLPSLECQGILLPLTSGRRWGPLVATSLPSGAWCALPLFSGWSMCVAALIQFSNTIILCSTLIVLLAFVNFALAVIVLRLQPRKSRLLNATFVAQVCLNGFMLIINAVSLQRPDVASDALIAAVGLLQSILSIVSSIGVLTVWWSNKLQVSRCGLITMLWVVGPLCHEAKMANRFEKNAVKTLSRKQRRTQRVLRLFQNLQLQHGAVKLRNLHPSSEELADVLYAMPHAENSSSESSGSFCRPSPPISESSEDHRSMPPPQRPFNDCFAEYDSMFAGLLESGGTQLPLLHRSEGVPSSHSDGEPPSDVSQSPTLPPQGGTPSLDDVLAMSLTPPPSPPSLGGEAFVSDEVEL